MKKFNFKIEKGIPRVIPYGCGVSKYPFNKMEIGDSFSFSSDTYAGIQAAARSWGLRHNVKFSISKANLRIWRIE